ncbi:MAG: ribbon-helix-helix protein, CopG family [Verrucomicrobiota bacterium]
MSFQRKMGIAFYGRLVFPFSGMTTITCKIPERIDTELEAVAEKRGVSKSTVIREAIEANLEQQKRRVKLSAHDVMKDACGVIKGGPRDRSWNPKRMEGFGRD